MISVIIPTYNERENITKLVPAIHGVLGGHEYETIIVDDNSPDGTARIAGELFKTYPGSVLERSGKIGLASAVLHGFSHARGDVLGVIDADLQHPPEYINDFVVAILDGHDIAVGSRYTEGGKIEGWSTYRSLVSKGAKLLSRPLTDVSDPMSGYFFLKRKVIDGIPFCPRGYKILLEILAKGSYESIKEIPYTFKKRENGDSKLGIGEYGNYLRLLFHLYNFRFRKKLLEGGI